MPGSRARLAATLVGVLALASIAASVWIVTPTIWLDDPFIGVRYARNLAEGKGLVFNPGDPVEGYTAFGWVMVAWVAILLKLDPLNFWQVLLCAAQVGTLFLVYELGRSESRHPYRSLLAPALLAFQVGFVTWPMMGMSTSFFSMLVTLAVVLMQRRILESRSGALKLGAVLLVMCLTRFDGLVAAAFLLGYAVLVDRDLRKLWPTLLVLGVGLVVYNAWRIGYYGKPLPNTFYAKQSTLGEDVRMGLAYWRNFARHGGPYLMLMLLTPFLLWRPSRGVKLCVWMCVGHFCYVTAVGGDWMKYFRFVLTVLPLMCFLMQEGLWRAGERLERVLSRQVATALVSILVVGVLGWNLRPLLSSGWVGGLEHRRGPYWHAEDARDVARYLDRSLPPDAFVATEWAGIIPYYMRQPILDIFGLNDSEIIESDFPGSKMGKGITPEYLVKRSPDLVIVVARIFPTAEEALASLDNRPEGTNVKKFYAALELPEHGYRPCVAKVREGGFWACLVRSGFSVEGFCQGR